MTVYVDDARISFRRMKMSHMMADTTDELLDMAERLHLQDKWIQKAGTPEEHFDVCESYRQRAIGYGAKSVTSRDLVELVRRKRGNC